VTKITIRRIALAACVAFAIAGAAARRRPGANAHVAAAKAAAGTEFAGVFSRICTEAAPSTPRGDARGRAAAADSRARRRARRGTPSR